MNNSTKVQNYLNQIRELTTKQRTALANKIPACKKNDSHAKLVAYMAQDSSQVFIKEHELRLFLQQYLPAQMIPSEFIMLDQLPRTISGKIDRNNLPDEVRPLSTEHQTDPAELNTTEKIIADIWTEVLETEDINTLDDFLSLGGDSLLATRVIARVRKHFSIEISPRMILDHPVLHEFSAAIDLTIQQNIDTDEREEFEI